MGFTQLDDWLGWLEQAHPTEIELGLDRLKQVLQRLELPDLPPTITVAGTNGKGSCVAAASALLQAAGYRVGSYTSPHIHHYCERVRVNADAVSESQMCRAFERINSARGEVSLTYFEFGTLAALVIFAQQSVDVMVLEVGLGGRLDAVNIIDPEVAVITSIAIDHEAWLGSDRESIGREKAGIMRSGKIAICTDANPPFALLQCAQEVGASLRLLGRDFTLEPENSTAEYAWRYTDTLDASSLLLPPLPLVASSVGAAIAAVKALGVDPASLALSDVLESLSLPGRMQKLCFAGTPVLLDVAHNPAATAYLAQVVAARQTPGRVIAIVAMMADKDIAGSLQPLMGLVDLWLTVDLAGVPRAASATRMAAMIAQCDAEVKALASLDDALARLRAGEYFDLGEGDLVLVFGSFFTVAAALTLLAPTVSQTLKLGGEAPSE